jgi:AraC-like DNA-binding protein
MEIQDILGIQVQHCKERKNYPLGYYDQSSAEFKGFALFLMTRGHARFNLRKSRLRAEKYDLVFGESEGILGLHPEPGETYSYFVLQFKPLGASEAPETIRPDFPPVFRVRRFQAVKGLFNALFKTFNSSHPYRLQECSILAIKLLRLIHETKEGHGHSRRRPLAVMDPRIRSILTYINDNFKSRLMIRDLAGRAGMHPTHFTRLFEGTTGLSPRRYVLMKKIEKAKDFLVLPEEVPDSTALELGFHDYSHFYRTFKRLTGMTPSQYMKRYRRRG